MKLHEILIATGVILLAISLAASVGIERAKTMKECYKAAQVNHNIKCEVPND